MYSPQTRVQWLEKPCQDFLRSLRRGENEVDEDGTWGYYVYLTYRTNESSFDKGDDPDETLILDKIQNYLVAFIKHNHPAPYNDRIIAGLTFKMMRLPSATQSAVRAHFRAHVLQAETPEKLMCGPRYGILLVVDDECRASIMAGPEPVLNLPAEKPYWEAQEGAKKVFVKAVEVRYDEARGGEVYYSSGRGMNAAVVWKGCLKVCLRSLMDLWVEANMGEFGSLYLEEERIWEGMDFG